MKWAWTQDLPMPQKLVLVSLAYHADEDGKAWPSTTTLAKKTGLSRRGLIMQIRKLEAQGFIDTESRYRPTGGQTSNGYVLDVEGVHHTCIPPMHDTCIPPMNEVQGEGVIAGAYHEIQYKIQDEIQSNGDSSQETPMKLEDVLTEHEVLTRGDIFVYAPRKDHKLTADGCAYLWRHCRASASDNGFQAELLIKEKKMLHKAYQRVGEDFNLAIWAVMSEWIDFTKYAAAHYEAFNLPTIPTVGFFTKFIEAAVSFASTCNTSSDSGFLQVTAKSPKALTKPNENKDNGDTAITSDELAAISGEIE